MLANERPTGNGNSLQTYTILIISAKYIFQKLQSVSKLRKKSIRNSDCIHKKMLINNALSLFLNWSITKIPSTQLFPEKSRSFNFFQKNSRKFMILPPENHSFPNKSHPVVKNMIHGKHHTKFFVNITMPKSFKLLIHQFN